MSCSTSNRNRLEQIRADWKSFHPGTFIGGVEDRKLHSPPSEATSLRQKPLVWLRPYKRWYQHLAQHLTTPTTHVTHSVTANIHHTHSPPIASHPCSSPTPSLSSSHTPSAVILYTQPQPPRAQSQPGYFLPGDHF